MPEIIKEIIIKNKQGLHARPAALFVQIAAKYAASVTVQKDAERVNGKSIMGILMLAVECGSMITVEASGEDANEVMAELEAFLTKDE